MKQQNSASFCSPKKDSQCTKWKQGTIFPSCCTIELVQMCPKMPKSCVLNWKRNSPKPESFRNTLKRETCIAGACKYVPDSKSLWLAKRLLENGFKKAGIGSGSGRVSQAYAEKSARFEELFTRKEATRWQLRRQSASRRRLW